jgi:hypothetical protein
MYCKQCGSTIQDGIKFCPSCGAPSPAPENNTPAYSQQTSYGSGGNGGGPRGQVRPPINVIIFAIITCGIYGLYWIYVTNKQINQLLGREDVGDGMVILSWFCGPVLWYIWYKWDKSLIDVSLQNNKNYKANFILWIVLHVLAGVGLFVCMFQVQDLLNSIYEENN